MVGPISVVAAVDACYSIAKEIYKYVERFVRFEAEVGDLNLRFETTIQSSAGSWTFSERRKYRSMKTTEVTSGGCS